MTGTGDTYIFGDIHGGYRGLMELLGKLRDEVQAGDKLIFLGDYVDGWSQSPEVLDTLIALESKTLEHWTENAISETTKRNIAILRYYLTLMDLQVILLRGNHDDLLLNYLKDNTAHPKWVAHGGQSSIDAYAKVDAQRRERHMEFLSGLRTHYVTSELACFHAGFTNVKGHEHEWFHKMFYWDRSLWETALALDPTLEKDDKRYPKRLKLYPEIYIGHTPTIRLDSTEPINAACVWNLDTGAAFYGPLTAMRVRDKRYWQSTPVRELYPDEPGRME